MSFVKRFFTRLRNSAARPYDERLKEEIEEHVALQTAENIKAGMPPSEARRQALLKFGAVEVMKEDYRAERRFLFFDTLLQDVRYALRMLHKSPGFTIVAVLTLALAIGANTAIFSLMNAVMLRTLPVKSPEQLVLLDWVSQKRPPMMVVQSGYEDDDLTGRMTSPSFSYSTFEQMRATNQVFSGLFGFVPLGTTEVSVEGHVQLAEGELVTGNYFSGLGVSPTLGRQLTDQDEKIGAPPVALISYGYWSRQFGRNPGAVGKHITVNGVPFTITGVAPPEFFGVQPGRRIDVWVPFVDSPKLLPWGEDTTPDNRSPFTSRDWWWLMMIGRLKPGVDVRRATAQAETLFQQNILANVKTPPRPEFIPHIELRSASRGLAMLREQFSEPLWILMIAVGVVLLIACANVASLLLVRSAAREKEIVVRLSLGAGRWRLMRQMMTESVLLAAIGGTIGLLFAYWGGRALLLLMSSGGEKLDLSVQLDAKVLGFSAGVALLTGILFGLLPALRSTRVDLTPALKETCSALTFVGHRRLLRHGNFLVVAQVALSLLLLIGAGLFLRTLDNLENQKLGFNQRHLLLFAMDPTTHGYEGPRLMDLYARLLTRFQTLPGATAGTMSEIALVSDSQSHSPISIEGYVPQGGTDMGVDLNGVGPSFFTTMEIPLLVGRSNGWNDAANSPKIAVVNKEFVNHFFAGRDAIGRRFVFSKIGDAHQDYEVVGVVGDAKYAQLRNAVRPTVYLPWTQLPYPLGGMHFELRTAGDPLALVSSVRGAVHDVDSTLPVAEFKTQSEQIAETLVQERLFAEISSFFAVLAVLLACIGLYGLIAYSVVRQTREIGVRMALGARPGDVLRTVIGHGMALTGIGIVIGIGAALVLTRFLESLLFDVKPADALTFVAVATVLATVASFACYIPARRAMRVDPMVALRYE